MKMDCLKKASLDYIVSYAILSDKCNPYFDCQGTG